MQPSTAPSHSVRTSPISRGSRRRTIAWRASLGGGSAPEQDALSGDQQFFLAYAQSYQSKDRDAVLRERLATDGHAPARYRVATVRNIDAWYTAFDVKDTDKLYLAPEARVRVW